MKKASLCFVFAILSCGFAFGQAQYQVLYKFDTNQPGLDGFIPSGPVMFDSSGNMYGTTQSGGMYGRGAIFELSPSGTGWTETLLYSFCPGGVPCPDGEVPESGVIMDATGNLYGTTPFGGGFCGGNERTCGTVFELSPPSLPGGNWTQTVLAVGCNPSGGLVSDQVGNLYGTLGCRQGYVFELSPPTKEGQPWIPTALYVFCPFASRCSDGKGPVGGVIFDNAGNLYGATQEGGHANKGVVYEISPTAEGGQWTEKVLASATRNIGYDPLAGLTFDDAGNLYGTLGFGGAHGDGAAFKLAHTIGGNWTGTVVPLTVGNQPESSLLVEGGVVYGTTDVGGTGRGTIFQITGQTQTALYVFCSLPNCADGANPQGPLILQDGNFYGVTTSGGLGFGVVYEITP